MVRIKEKDNCIYLTDGKITLLPDFESYYRRLKGQNLSKENLIRACNIKNSNGLIRAIDATAGLGEDSFLLAAFGFNVTMYEHNPIIYKALNNAIERPKNIDEISLITNRMTLINEDFIEASQKIKTSFDLVYLDPMFPARTKSSLVKKKLQLLQGLELPVCDEAGLFNAAKAINPQKIVVKRPVKSDYLANIKPNHSITGKVIRFDVYIN